MRWIAGKPSSEPLARKIALEEHFVLAETMDTSYESEIFTLRPDRKSSTSAVDASRTWIVVVSISAFSP